MHDMRYLIRSVEKVDLVFNVYKIIYDCFIIKTGRFAAVKYLYTLLMLLKDKIAL